jgi:endonuclease/exonuclease/phosphatase family metal-dependent hydrolase
MQLAIMSVNTQYGGWQGSDGRPQTRWPGLVDVITGVRPHILLLQEAHGWQVDPRQQANAEADLGMRALVAPSRSGGHTAVMYDTRVLRWQQFETKYAGETHHGFGVAVLDLLHERGPGVPLTVISAHLHPYSARKAASEADLLAGRVHRYGGMGLIGGDINHVPPGDPEPDWTTVPPYNRSSRCRRRADLDDPWRANTIVGETLRDADLVDVAAHLADTTGDTRYRAPTARQGGVRADQIWITPNLLPALTGYRQITTKPFSDHDAIVVTLDTTHLHHVSDREWT